MDYICSERHFRTPSVRICTVPQSLSRTAHLGCEYTHCTYLGNPVAHCTPVFRHRDHSRQFPLPCTTICSERNFRTPSVRVRTVPQSLSRTADLGCEYTNFTYLGNPVAHCAPGDQLRDRSWQFTISWTTTYSERHFRTPSVGIRTVTQIRIRPAYIGCVNTNYTYLGGPVAHCTPGVPLRDRSHQFTIAWTTMCRERHFRTPSVRICTVPLSMSRTAHLGREYTNCIYLGNPVAHCTPGFRHQDYSRQFTLPCATICNERHFSTPSVRICTVPQIPTRTAHLDCVNTNYTYLGGLIAHCTPAVLRDHSRQFTMPWTTTHTKWHFCTPAVRFGTVARSLSRTVHLDCEYTNSTKLAGPVVPRTGVY